MVTWTTFPPLESKSYFACRGNPVISGVMDVDWHYYLLIAPHSSSSPFEDQSGRVPLCAPTLINPEWTSIKPTVHSVHLSLLTPLWPCKLKALLNQQRQTVVGHFALIAQSQKISGLFQQSWGCDFKCMVVWLNGNVKDHRQPGWPFGSWYGILARPLARCWLHSSSVNFRHCRTQRMNEKMIQVTWWRNRWGS